MDKYLEWIKDLFPDLYALAVDREASVTLYLANPSEGEVGIGILHLFGLFKIEN